MSATEEILRVLKNEYRRELDPTAAAVDVLARHDAEHRAAVLREAADKLALELAPEQPGAGPGFLLALRLAVRAARRMADAAAVGGAE